MPTETQWAWVAGLFEGEGTIAFVGVHSVSVSVEMVDRDVIETLNALVPAPNGVLDVKRRGPRWQPSYLWKITARDQVAEFLLGVEPWLGNRRGARVREALKRLRLCAGSNVGKARCPQGHPYDSENTYCTPGGRRRCRTCNRERQRVRRAA